MLVDGGFFVRSNAGILGEGPTLNLIGLLHRFDRRQI